MSLPFPSSPSITVFDPLAQFLGAGDGLFHYTFEDVVKLSGHACPTVAGAFLMAIRALDRLYGEDTPQRGGVEVTLPGMVDQGVNGPISQVFTLLTGAAAENGFKGLGGQFARNGLMKFGGEGSGFHFHCVSNGASVTVAYDPSTIPPDPEMNALMQQVMQGEGGEEVRQRFQSMWRERVVRILEDGGEQTLSYL